MASCFFGNQEMAGKRYSGETEGMLIVRQPKHKEELFASLVCAHLASPSEWDKQS